MTAPATFPVVVRSSESISDRIKGLQDQTQALAAEHVRELTEAMRLVERLAHEIATGGDSYPVGIREIARRLGEDMAFKSMTADALMGRR